MEEDIGYATEHVAYGRLFLVFGFCSEDPIGYRCIARIRGDLLNDSFIARIAS